MHGINNTKFTTIFKMLPNCYITQQLHFLSSIHFTSFNVLTVHKWRWQIPQAHGYHNEKLIFSKTG